MAASSSDRPAHLIAAAADVIACRARQQPAHGGADRTKLFNTVNALPAAKAASASSVEAPRAVAHLGTRRGCKEEIGAEAAHESICNSVARMSGFYHLISI
jgi:hypothetical protein